MTETKIYRPLKAIRLKCLDCSCGSQAEVARCVMKDCTLWPYRSGHRPGWTRTRKEGVNAPDDAQPCTLNGEDGELYDDIDDEYEDIDTEEE